MPSDFELDDHVYSCHVVIQPSFCNIAMIPGPRFKAYANNNEPPPENLLEPLNKMLSKLDSQLAGHDQERKGIAESITARQAMIWALERDIEMLERVEARLVMALKNTTATSE
ncbi:hypothetical protein BKA70DRAFT_1426821 [Coprinopsis sp. MPI-PUGE-AT-0042]|nr:hypothetical protein BKA70DRAFT_1426821 [Coprinopsis sp. MPI-PUGE-AT-0042]